MTHIAIIALIVIIVVSSVAYGSYTLLSQSPSSTPSPSPSSTPEISPSPSISPTPTITPSSSPTSSPTPTSTPTSEPTATPTPTGEPTPTPKIVGVVDATGAQVNVTMPVNRIICLTSAEAVYALGAGDKIVAISGMLTTDAKAVLPSSILNLPIVGDTDITPNMELIVQLQPDLVLASQRLTDGNRKTLEAAGIAVIEDSQTGNRRNQYLNNLGLILDSEQRVDEILSYEKYYLDLVQERVGSLSRSEKPLVYFEWYKAWFSTGPGGSYTALIEAAGGINVGENATVSSPQLSAEFVLEQNPDIIIRMLDYTSGEDLQAFQKLMINIMGRSGVSETNAAANGQVHVIKSTLLVERDVVGLLYFAKWFHPDLFADIDPAAVHAEMIQKYYGASLKGVYLYP